MRPGLLLMLLAALVLVFAGINWPLFTSSTEINLLVATVQAPLGLVLLAMVAILLVALAATLAWARTAVLLQTRTHKKESDRLHALADQAEASRIAELRQYLESALRDQALRASESSAQMMARLDALERGLRQSQEQGDNSLAAYIGELEDRLNTAAGSTDVKRRPS